MECIIRPFTESDTEQVIALWTSVFGYSAPHNDPATVIRQKLAVDPQLFLVAVSHDRVVGTVMGGYDGHRGWIYTLAVHPDHRGRGTGSELVRQVERLLLDLGCLKINLQMIGENGAVAAFYERLGFRIEHRISMGKTFLPDGRQNG